MDTSIFATALARSFVSTTTSAERPKIEVPGMLGMP
jgi:hypothetical protein